MGHVDGKARLYMKKIKEHQRFGVAVMNDGSTTDIIEEPTDCISDLVVTGLYLYPPDVFYVVWELSP